MLRDFWEIVLISSNIIRNDRAMLLHVDYITFPDDRLYEMSNYNISREGKRMGKNVYNDFNLYKNKDICESSTHLLNFQVRWETD